MNDLPRQKLAELVAKRRDVVRDHRLCRALLLDLCGQYRGEIRILTLAVEEGIAAELLDNSTGSPAQALIARLSKRLHDNCRVVEADAHWAVESWALALGVATTADLSLENAARTPPAVGAKQGRFAGAPSQPPRLSDDGRIPCHTCEPHAKLVTLDIGRTKTVGLLGLRAKTVDVAMSFAWIPPGAFLMGSKPIVCKG